ncbi:MAG: PorT family protein [Muribaculaceae bacterium]|nr:PorT family protein [Muribaculaceae bacterium]
MKRRVIIISLLLATLTALSGMAQSAMNRPVMWGLKASLQAELPDKWRNDVHAVKMYDTGFGFTLGGVCNIWLGSDFYFEPGVSFFYEGYSYDEVYVMAPDNGVVEKSPSLYKVGLRVPLQFGYSLGINDRVGCTFFTGPQLGYALGGKVQSRPEYGSDFSTDLFGMHCQRRFDLAWKVGVGVLIDRFMVSVEGDLGITDQLKGDMTFRENRVGVGLTYYF